MMACGGTGAGTSNTLVSANGPTPSPTPTVTPTPVPSPLPTPTPPPVPSGLTVSPSTANVALDTTQTFTATGPNAPVNWSVNGIPGGNPLIGTISSTGVYTPPAIFPATNGFTVTATSQASPSASANASLTVVYPNNTAGVQSLPLQLGVTGGNSQDFTANACCIGTLGSLWNFNGAQYILSNSHILARSGQGIAGEAINQPGAAACFSSPNAVANLSFQSALQPTPTSNGIAESNVDAALALIVPGAVDPSGAILNLGVPGTTSIASAPPSATLELPSLKMSVAKTGRTTGLTCSTLAAINTSITIDYPSFCGGPTLFTSIFVSQLAFSGGSSFSAPGDAGSLIVDTANARAIGLLVGGNGDFTIAHPIGAVIDAFSSHARPPVVLNIVGGADHLVSCQPMAAVPGASQAAPLSAQVSRLPAQERTRTQNAREAHALLLMRDPAITAVEAGASADAPGQGALEVRVSGTPQSPIPAMIDGVRTRVTFASAIAPTVSQDDIDRASAIKEAHAVSLMSQPGIQGVGVAISKDNPGEPALAIFVIRGTPISSIPATVEGLRTQILEGEKFHLY
ncbi:MAG TPA: hypothetical protein VFB76_13525 [Candidatus Angelobacter sp.]|nr:hypothetical protein [Candidatus Angelobacter sp.]